MCPRHESVHHQTLLLSGLPTAAVYPSPREHQELVTLWQLHRRIMSSTEPPEVWLEDLDVEHLRDVYKMFLDPTMELLRFVSKDCFCTARTSVLKPMAT